MGEAPRRVGELVGSIERVIRERPRQGALGPQAVLAMDALMHALIFSAEPRALELWREALWEGRLSDGSRAVLSRMLEHITVAVARGEHDAAGAICNCLRAVMEPNAFAGIEPISKGGNDARSKRKD